MKISKKEFKDFLKMSPNVLKIFNIIKMVKAKIAKKIHLEICKALGYIIWMFEIFLAKLVKILKKPLTNDTIYNTIVIWRGCSSTAGVQKIIDKMKRQPNGIRPDEADRVLRAWI